MNECISLTNNQLQSTDDLDDSSIIRTLNENDIPRRPLGGLLKNLSLKDPQLAYQESEEAEPRYRTIPNAFNSSSDSSECDDQKYEQTYLCTDHGEVASNKDDDSDNASHNSDEDGGFVSYWEQREIGWNDSQSVHSDGRYHDPVDTHDGNNLKRWFRRRNNEFQNKNNDRSEQHDNNDGHREGRWSLRKKHTRHNNNLQREEILVYCATDIDNVDSHPSTYDDDDSSDDCGHTMPTPVNPSQKRSQSPLRLGRHDKSKLKNNHSRRNGPLANLLVIRPFLIRSQKGFKDNPHEITSSGGIDDESLSDYTTDNPSQQDRDIVMQSISEGISGVQDESLALDADDYISHQHHNLPPRFLQPIARLLNGPDEHRQQRNTKVAIKDFHKLLRKEDWNLATTMLRSNPLLPRTWHHVTRLYGGKFDGEVLPLHAACALCPPASFVEELASIYPEALLAKEKSFGRVPLHVACRSLADSSVIKVLCEMEPKSVVAKDTLNRVALHYLIKNYASLGNDIVLKGDDLDEDKADKTQTDVECCFEIQIIEKENEPTNEDGLVALKILLDTNPKCVRVEDHRLWIPLHVACSSSSRRGMTNVIKLLLDAWPHSIFRKTSKGSDAFDCVDMSGKHHPTKDLVLHILENAKEQMQDDLLDYDDGEAASKKNHEVEFDNSDEGDAQNSPEELLISLDHGGDEDDPGEKFRSGNGSAGEMEVDRSNNTGDVNDGESIEAEISQEVNSCEGPSTVVTDGKTGIDSTNHTQIETEEIAIGSRTEILNWYV